MGDKFSFKLFIRDKHLFFIIEFTIWQNDENIQRIRISKNWFIDSTFHRPKEFEQLLIIIYIDELTNEKIPGIFVLINCKIQEIYEKILMSICNIITQNNTLDFNLKAITSDSEDSCVMLLNSSSLK